MTIRNLVRHALRDRPDHIAVGGCDAPRPPTSCPLNTGHGGSLAMVQQRRGSAVTPTCGMQARDDLPWAVVCRRVVDGIEAVIHQTRTPRGSAA